MVVAAKLLMAGPGSVLAAAIETGGPGFKARGTASFGGRCGGLLEGDALGAQGPLHRPVIEPEMTPEGFEVEEMGPALRAGDDGGLGELNDEPALEVIGGTDKGCFGRVGRDEIAATERDRAVEGVDPEGESGPAIAVKAKSCHGR
jgi:hypothetical protein